MTWALSDPEFIHPTLTEHQALHQVSGTQKRKSTYSVMVKQTCPQWGNAPGVPKTGVTQR